MGRNGRLDMLKAILAFLVILGHVLQIRITTGDATTIMQSAKYFIYSFHMPLFIALTGYFLEGKIISPILFLRKKSLQLLSPLTVWGVLISLYDYKVTVR